MWCLPGLLLTLSQYPPQLELIALCPVLQTSSHPPSPHSQLLAHMYLGIMILSTFHLSRCWGSSPCPVVRQCWCRLSEVQILQVPSRLAQLLGDCWVFSDNSDLRHTGVGSLQIIYLTTLIGINIFSILFLLFFLTARSSSFSACTHTDRHRDTHKH